jgi:hypothetical protein
VSLASLGEKKKCLLDQIKPRMVPLHCGGPFCILVTWVKPLWMIPGPASKGRVFVSLAKKGDIADISLASEIRSAVNRR